MAAMVRRAWIAAAHALAAACWGAALTWLVLPRVHGVIAAELASRTSLHLPGAWTLTGLGGLAATLGVGVGAGAVAFLLALLWERRARLWTAGAGLALVLLVAPWRPLESIGRQLYVGGKPTRAQIEDLFPAGPYLVETLADVRWPLASPARVTSGFGYRLHPTLGGRRFHSGIDISVAEGTPVLAATSGRVTRASEDPVNGKFVVVMGPGRVRTAYCHLSRLDVAAGDTVIAGSLLGASGSTGRATGPHLHFGLWKRGRAVDPLRVALR